MRIGGGIEKAYHNPEEWVKFAKDLRYSAVLCPVDSVREIIDAVKPTNTFYTIEPMPWVLPDSPEQYLKLIQDVDRKEFAVHLDFVNMINCPERFCKSTEFVKRCFELLGPYIKSIHCKDSVMEQAYTAIIHETMPGKGTLDYKKILPLVENLGKDIPLFVEHLPDYETYRQAVPIGTS